MLEAFRLGGWGMFPTLICGVLTVVVSLRYAVKPEKRLVPLIITTNVMTLVAGTLGFVTGLIATSKYIGGGSESGAVQTAQVPLIAVVGTGESLHNIALALILMMFAAIAATIGAFRLSRESEA